MKKIESINAVNILHDIARAIEEEFIYGQLSEDIRSCADRLHILTQGVKIVNESYRNVT
jgi:hypothetical protein